MAVQKLSRFYKLTLSRKQSLSTIQDELEHVSIYVELLNMRFADNIDLSVDMPDSLMERPIPKLTFQPVVENSILHGIMEKEEKEGTIVLTGWEEEHGIVILTFWLRKRLRREAPGPILRCTIPIGVCSSCTVWNMV